MKPLLRSNGKRKNINMPSGKGTYGTKRGRPPKDPKIAAAVKRKKAKKKEK